MAPKKKAAAKPINTIAGFDADPETGKIVGPGTNPSEVQFYGNPQGPFYVHKKNGQPMETISESAEAPEGWFLEFGGTQEECANFLN